jgi:hypothetical protein
MSAEARLDRIEKVRSGGVMSRKVGSAYACAWGALDSEPVKVVNKPPEYGLHRRGWKLAKVIGDWPETRWAEVDDPDARWAEDLADYRCAQINAYALPTPGVGGPRFTSDEIWAAVILIIRERKAGIEPEVSHR